VKMEVTGSESHNIVEFNISGVEPFVSTESVS
jgi:hypothetical protein